MYNSNNTNKGQYSKWGFIKRGLELISPNEFFRFQNEHIPHDSFICKFIMFFDFYICVIRYGTIVSDYFAYQFYKKKHYERKTYITMLKSMRIQKFFNNGNHEILVNKKLFNKHFESVRSTCNFYFDEQNSFDDFYRFINDCNYKILIKPYFGACGVGIFKPDVSTIEKARKIYDEYNGNDKYFCEELFIQTGPLNEVNPNCVNTIRIYTIYDGKEVHIMNTCVRFGGGTAIVDNIHSGGMSCSIDKELGVISRPGYNLLNEEFVTHKLTGVILPGLKIPRWFEVLEYCKKAALLIPNYGYIGWDVAVSNDKICIIEGNENANVDLPQTALQKGLLKEYLDVIKKTKEIRNSLNK